MRELVFQPLGLEHAGTTAGDFIVNRFAAGHTCVMATTTLQRPFGPSASVTAGGVGLCMTDLLAYARFHMGDGTAASGERVLDRRIARTDAHAAAPQAGHRRRHRARVAHSPRWAHPHVRTRRHVRRPHPAARDRARAELRDRHPHEREHRLARDPGRRARGARSRTSAPPTRRTRRSRIAGWSRRSPRSNRSRNSPIRRRTSARTCGRATRSSSAADGTKVIVQDQSNSGSPRDYAGRVLRPRSGRGHGGSGQRAVDRVRAR